MGRGYPWLHGRHIRLVKSKYSARESAIQGNRALDLIGYLHCNIFNQDKFLINGVEVKMRLVRSKDLFYLMESKTISKIRILDGNLLEQK